MAFTKSLNFGSIFLYKEICSHPGVLKTATKPLVAVNLGIHNIGSRAYSKCMSYSVGRNGLIKVFSGEGSSTTGLSKIRYGPYSFTTVTLKSRPTVFPYPYPVFQSINMYSSGSNPVPPSNSSSTNLSQNSPKKSNESESQEKLEQETATPPSEQPLSKKEKLKQAVRDYGATVIVFHVTMSLMSLGFFYLLVQSGLDVVGLLAKLGISESFTQSKITEEAGKFVFAYAVHKVFAPLRITITLTATPLIVRKLRSMGILKQMAKKTKTQ